MQLQIYTNVLELLLWHKRVLDTTPCLVVRLIVVVFYAYGSAYQFQFNCSIKE